MIRRLLACLFLLTVASQARSATLSTISGPLVVTCGDAQCTVSWTDSANTVGHTVDRCSSSCTSAGATWTEMCVAAAGATSCSADTGLANNTTYTYRIRANPFTTATGTPATVATTTVTTTTATTATTLPTGFPWKQREGGTTSEYGEVVDIDPSGNLIVMGRYGSGATDWGTGSIPCAGNYDIVLAKYTSAGTPVWVKGYGTTGTEFPYGMTVDSSGNIIVVGGFVGTGNFGGTDKANLGSWDIFVAKYSNAGNHVWSQTIGTAGADIAQAVATTSTGDVVVTGWGAFGGVSNQKIIVAKLAAADGSTIFQKTDFVSTAGNQGRGVAVDSGGNILLTGWYNGTISFGGANLPTASVFYVFVSKLTSTGAHVWSEGFGTPSGNSIGTALVLDTSGNPVVTGTFNASVDFGGGALTSAGVQDIFLAKYTSGTGAHVWSRRMGGAAYDEPGPYGGLAIDGSGNVYLTGDYQQSASFGGSTFVSKGGPDVFVAKYNGSTGAHISSQTFGGPDEDDGSGVAVDTGNNAYILGSFRGTSTYAGGSLTSAGATDAFIVGLGQM